MTPVVTEFEDAPTDGWPSSLAATLILPASNATVPKRANALLLRISLLRSFHKRSIITDQELITGYLFGHLQRRFKQKMIHCYVQEHWGACFPQLPSYQTFNHRLNLQRLSIEYRLA